MIPMLQGEQVLTPNGHVKQFTIMQTIQNAKLLTAAQSTLVLTYFNDRQGVYI